jgi:3-(3-hydroxy-phenyl)propionate hydroxylase
MPLHGSPQAVAMHTDVIISGLGPTGATLAALLGQRGIKVLVVDKMPGLYPLPRAIGLDQEAMRTLQELGITSDMDHLIAPYRPTEYRGMDGELIKRLDTAPPPYPLGWAPNYVFNQPGVEQVLRRRIEKLPSVEVQLQAEIVNSGQERDRAWVDVRKQGSKVEERYEASYLIACDGGASPIRTRLNIELEDLGFDEPWLVVDAIVPDEKLLELPQTQVQYCEASRPCTFVVGPGNHRRWEIMLNPGDSLSADYPEEELWPLLRRWIQPGEAQIWRSAAYRFHSLVAKQWRRGRILLAGDAAHMTPPFMAQGMCQGMRDAKNLAWKLDRVLRDESGDDLLNTYATERRPHVLKTTATAIGLGRVICERDPAKAIERDERLRAENSGAIVTAYRQSMIPGLEAGMCEFSTAGAGSLAFQPTVVCGPFRGPLDELAGHRFVLIASGALSVDDERAYMDALAPIQGVLIHLVPEGCTRYWMEGTARAYEVDALFQPWLEALGQCCAVVRPDHYVFGTAKTHADGLRLLRKLDVLLDPELSTMDVRLEA